MSFVISTHANIRDLPHYGKVYYMRYLNDANVRGKTQSSLAFKLGTLEQLTAAEVLPLSISR